MFAFLLSCFSFIIVLKTSCFEPFLVWLTHIRVRLLSPMHCLSLVSCLRSNIYNVFQVGFHQSPMIIDPSNDAIENKGNTMSNNMSFLDLPELALDSILERLTPAELCSMGGVCSYLRDRCGSNHIWEKHVERKWGRVIGNVAFREWKWHMATTTSKSKSRKYSVIRSFFSVRPFSLIRTMLEPRKEVEGCLHLPSHSVMSWYLSLENGEFWFPAQVYNREKEHDGFMMSCYDAKLSYNLKTDTFQARYSPCGRQSIEENVSWSRLRAPPIDACPYSLHVSDCLDDLKPRDHFEIQWRRNREYRYGWWYGVVGHLDECSRNLNECSCHDSDMVILEFNHYATDSRWRRTVVHRKNHQEEGNEADGFYGGIRKLHCPNEISTWLSLWPNKVLH